MINFGVAADSDEVMRLLQSKLQVVEAAYVSREEVLETIQSFLPMCDEDHVFATSFAPGLNDPKLTLTQVGVEVKLPVTWFDPEFSGLNVIVFEINWFDRYISVSVDHDTEKSHSLELEGVPTTRELWDLACEVVQKNYPDAFIRDFPERT